MRRAEAVRRSMRRASVGSGHERGWAPPSARQSCGHQPLLYFAAAYDEPIQLDSGLQSPRMGSFLFKG